MINFCKYDTIVVKFPFASSLKYKARPAVVISNQFYNNNSRNSLLILAISSKVDSKLEFEIEITDWKEAGLLKPSIFKSSIATIEKDFVITKLGKLSYNDSINIEKLLNNMLKEQKC